MKMINCAIEEIIIQNPLMKKHIAMVPIAKSMIEWINHLWYRSINKLKHYLSSKSSTRGTCPIKIVWSYKNRRNNNIRRNNTGRNNIWARFIKKNFSSRGSCTIVVARSQEEELWKMHSPIERLTTPCWENWNW